MVALALLAIGLLFGAALALFELFVLLFVRGIEFGGACEQAVSDAREKVDRCVTRRVGGRRAGASASARHRHRFVIGAVFVLFLLLLLAGGGVSEERLEFGARLFERVFKHAIEQTRGFVVFGRLALPPHGSERRHKRHHISGLRQFAEVTSGEQKAERRRTLLSHQIRQNTHALRRNTIEHTLQPMTTGKQTHKGNNIEKRKETAGHTMPTDNASQTSSATRVATDEAVAPVGFS